ncbi:MlaD family protein [Desulfopila sp. IMCC35008]|uniref:MlaD family protein n=1 Tax=Desulfopila sp. IMCC35008 TaxID=2653858 RepID=UPI0013D4BDBA|nr:MlaD family protein [Desulfopila sp. IMCC35008]
MAKQANTMMIGGFVVIAFFLLAASIVVLGSGKLFQRTTNFVLYFDNSINGLSVGAPVLFKGVRIGSVSSIVINANPQDLTVNIPVIIEVDADKFHVVDSLHVDENSYSQRTSEETIGKLVEQGLRAVLGTQSLITGQLMIELEYYPDSPVDMKRIKSPHPEIPTIPSTTEKLYKTLQKIDFIGLAEHLKSTMAGIDELVNNPDISDGLKSMRETADASQQLVTKLDQRIDTVIDGFEGTILDTRMLVANVNQQVQPLSNDTRLILEHFDLLVQDVNKRVGSLADNLNESLTGIHGVVSEDAPVVIQLEETLVNISDMADSIRQLADYLEQHPEALIRGKGSY